MTDAEKDAVWRSLPEGIREELRMKFEETHHVDKDMYDSGWNGATSSLLIKLFGKHNLTATEEEKPSRSLTNGDKVIILSEPFTGIYGEVNDFVFDEGKVFVQVVTKIGEKLIEPQKLELISSTTQNCEKSAENGISKEDAKELAKCLAAVDDFIKESKESQVDWLAYRMELAKEVTPNVISALSDGGVSSFCDNVINRVATIVNGIVERLKGGEQK